MSDLRFDWHPSLSSPLIDERLELLVQEALKDYKSGSGIQPRATYEASYRVIGKHLISALYCAYHAKERVSLPMRPSAYGMGKLGRIQYSFRDTSKVREALVNLGWLSVEEEGTQGRYTLVAATGDLARAFNNWGLRWMLPELLSEQACVCLRDVKRDTEGKPIRSGRKKQTTKVELEVPESSLVAQHRSNLTYINNKLRQHCISLDFSNEHLMQLLIMADACKRASANSVSAVIPYFGYSRQDRRPRNTRGPVSAKLVADLIETADIKRVITVDLHADQIEGFFSIPVDNIYSSTILMSDMWRQGYSDQVIVSPDVGGVGRARAIARRLGNASLAIIDKRREAANKSEVMNIIGDVDQKTAIIFDDMVDTAGTLCNAAAALKEKGALKTVAYAAHPVLSGPAIERIVDSELDELVVIDTIPLTEEAKDTGKIRQLTIAELLGETIERIVADQSVSSLYAE